MRSIELSVASRRVAGTVFGSDDAGPRPGILFAHGLHSDQSTYRERAQQAAGTLGAVCLTFDLSGHGASDTELDTLTPRDHLSDITAAYEALVAEPAVDSGRIGVCGASYGAYLAALLAGRRKVRRLLLRAPAIFSDEEFDRPLSQRRQFRLSSSVTMLMSSLAAFDGQMLVVESGADEVIPPEMISAYLAASSKARHLVLAGATHRLTDPAWRQQFIATILEFFSEL